MVKRSTKFSEVIENEALKLIGTILLGLFIIASCAVLVYFMNYWNSGFKEVSRAIASLGTGAGAVIIVLGIWQSAQVQKVPRIPFTCPYCNTNNLFPETPVDDFDCENCNRTVHFQDGKPVPVRDLVCEYCRSEHRVAVNVMSYVCDRCNRPLRLRPDPKFRTAVVMQREMPAVDELLQNYDVLLVAVDRRQEGEVAFKIQNLLVTNLAEARRLMATASPRTPLILGHDLPQRKAEAIKRALQDLGATATIRPTRAAQAAPRSR